MIYTCTRRHLVERLLGVTFVSAGLLAWATLLSGRAGLAVAQTAGPSWSYTGSLNTSRVGHTATLLLNGKVLEFNRAFVLMQYFGYLRRNPDDAPEPGLNLDGYNFWLNKLNRFGGDFVQAEMVKAFITSDEYRRRFSP